MRVNVYAEEMTDRVEIISKEIDGQIFTGLRIYLELPATVGGKQYQGPFMHHPGDDNSSAVTFWGKRDLREVLKKASELLDAHYANGSHRWLPLYHGADVEECTRCFTHRRRAGDAYEFQSGTSIMWVAAPVPTCVP